MKYSYNKIYIYNLIKYLRLKHFIFLKNYIFKIKRLIRKSKNFNFKWYLKKKFNYKIIDFCSIKKKKIFFFNYRV